MAYKDVQLREGQEFITTNILLKITGLIQTGGMAKIFLKENQVYVNDELDNRRGRKLYVGDKIKINGEEFRIKR